MSWWESHDHGVGSRWCKESVQCFLAHNGVSVSPDPLPLPPLRAAGLSARKQTFTPRPVTTFGELPPMLQRKGFRGSPASLYWLHPTSPEVYPSFPHDNSTKPINSLPSFRVIPEKNALSVSQPLCPPSLLPYFQPLLEELPPTCRVSFVTSLRSSTPCTLVPTPRVSLASGDHFPAACDAVVNSLLSEPISSMA